MFHTGRQIEAGSVHRRNPAIALAIVLLPALAFTALVSSGGIPSLRHDWAWPAHSIPFGKAIVDATSGWVASGIGFPRAYPTDYITRTIESAFIELFGPFAAFVITVFAVGSACAYAGSRIARLAGAKPIVQLAAAVFLTFNPWVYAKMVAGHELMVLSYAGLGLLLAEAARRRPDNVLSSLYVLMILPQLQFLILSLPILAWLWLKRTPLVLITAIVVSAPIWSGLAAGASALAHIPYTLQWETVQSVPSSSALLLFGYFPGYLDAIEWAKFPMVLIVGLAIAAVIGNYRSRSVRLTAIGAAVAVIAATGLNSFAAPIFSAIVLKVPASGVFRELYDFLGIAALGYVALAAVAARRAFSVVAFLAAALALVCAWVVVPPHRYWVDARILPNVDVATSAGQRVALLPAFQPLSFRGFGSGTDPDASTASLETPILNQYMPTYPENVAFEQFVLHHDDRALSALGVSSILSRPWLWSGAAQLDVATNARSSLLRGDLGERPISHAILNPVPLVSLTQMPEIGSLDSRIGNGNVLFSDAAGLRGPGIPAEWQAYPKTAEVSFPQVSADPAKGWTAVALAEQHYPQIGQGLGGTATSSTQVLQTHTQEWTLAYVLGVLETETARFAGDGGYRWIHTGPGIHRFRCFGVCAIAASTTQSTRWPLEPPPRRMLAALSPRYLTPWMLTTDVPPHRTYAAIRFNERYEPSWLVLPNAGAYTHLRIDAAVNGWIVPPSSQTKSIYIIEGVAAIQFALAVLGLLWSAVLFTIALVRLIRSASGPRQALR